VALKSGLAEIIFQGGARTLLEGPAKLEIRSRMGAYLQQGKFTVTVENPLAKGFEVLAPGMKYTDLGTEFGVAVAANGEQELQVFRGTVQAEAYKEEQKNRNGGVEVQESPQSVVTPPTPVVIGANQAIHVAAPDQAGTNHKQIERIAANDKHFIRTDQINQIAGERSPEFGRWKDYRDELCKRPDLVAYYDFQADESDRKMLRNRSASGDKLDGRIEGAVWSDGHIPGKQSLKFGGRNDCVHVNIPGSFEALTIAVWVNVERPVNGAGGILMSDRFHQRLGQCHWQFLSDGSMQLAPCWSTSRIDAPRGFTTGSSGIVMGREDCGSWCHLAVVYDARKRTAQHYKNGRSCGTVTFDRIIPLVFGPSEIANWDAVPGMVTPIRNLPAQFSELLLVSRVMSADEVRELYERSGGSQ
jgi:hypothetical protein